jgi:Nucleotidyl transferase AbiEii toxin, Type IV TA system
MKNVAASVRDRLANQARSSGVPLTALMERFVIGRLLWRVSRSADNRKFVLKGAQLFSLWTNTMHRPTRDLDLLSFGDSSPENVRAYFAGLLAGPADPPDGLIWGTVHASPIREDQNYGGVRITVKVTLAGAIIPAQIDVGFGDAITPAPVEMNWQELLGFPEARLLAYPPETVIAEKLHAAVELGLANSRMKDFYDLYWLCRNMEFSSAVLSSAVRLLMAGWSAHGIPCCTRRALFPQADGRPALHRSTPVLLHHHAPRHGDRFRHRRNGIP